MATLTSEQQTKNHAASCGCSATKLSADQVKAQLKTLADWRLIDNGRQLRRDWKAEDFVAGMKFLGRVADLAEAENHHPDVHLEGYRHVWIALWTHSVDGLSAKDFALAAKIDRLADEEPLGEWET